MAELITNVNDQALKEDLDLMRFSEAFQLMMNRMGMSHFKYGNLADKYPHSVRGIDCAKERLRLYEESGNTENLLDAANFLIIEHLLPSHVKAHFRAQTSAESPGLLWRED